MSSGKPPEAADARDCNGLFCLLRPALERFARRRVRCCASAQDFAHDLSCEVLEWMPDSGPGLSAEGFIAWLGGRARSRAIDLLRRFARRRTRSLGREDEDIADAADLDPLAAVARTDLAEWIMGRLRKRLSRLSLEVFRRIALGGEPPAQVAAALGLTAKQVADRLYFATREARRLAAGQSVLPRKSLSKFFAKIPKIPSDNGGPRADIINRGANQ